MTKAWNADTAFEALSAIVGPGAALRRREPLGDKTTLRVGGPADLFFEPGSETELAAALKYCSETSAPFFILGRGSNLVVRDGGVRGLVISLGGKAFSEIRVEGNRLICGAGARLKHIANRARDLGLGGLEFLEGIPGSLGGALRMNAGAMGAAVFDRVETLRVMDFCGRASERTAAQMGAIYRNCPALAGAIAISAVLTGQPGLEPGALSERMKALGRKRWESQPKEPSAGCSFKNPREMPAGKLIDQLGLKGLKLGGASVSAVHGNFIVNDGTATAADVLGLMSMIRERVKAAEGIDLEPEVQIIGEDLTRLG